MSSTTKQIHDAGFSLQGRTAPTYTRNMPTKVATKGNMNRRHEHYEDYVKEEQSRTGYIVGPMRTLPGRTNSHCNRQPSKKLYRRRQHHQKPTTTTYRPPLLTNHHCHPGRAKQEKLLLSTKEALPKLAKQRGNHLFPAHHRRRATRSKEYHVIYHRTTRYIKDCSCIWSNQSIVHDPETTCLQWLSRQLSSFIH
jgi:hypothetical protein